MNSRLLNEHGGLRTFAVVFETGDEPVQGLQRFAREHQITGAQFTGIGALSRVVAGFFDPERQVYNRLTLDEQVEVLTLTGNFGTKRESGDSTGRVSAALHAHIVVGRADGTAHGGHLLEATVRPTLEVIVIETPRHLQRRLDPATGLALIDLDMSAASAAERS